MHRLNVTYDYGVYEVSGDRLISGPISLTGWPSVVGLYYEHTTAGQDGTVGVIIDGVDHGPFSAFTPLETAMRLRFYPAPGGSPDYGKVITMRMVTEAAEMTQTYPPGFTTIGGEAVPAA